MEPDIDSEKEGRKEMFYLTTHLTHFIYGYTEKKNARHIGKHVYAAMTRTISSVDALLLAISYTPV